MAEEGYLLPVADSGKDQDDVDWADLKASVAHASDVWKTRAQGKLSEWAAKAAAGEGRAAWRVALGEFLESNTTHLAIVVLLLIDLLATAIDILKGMHTTQTDLDDCIEQVETCRFPSSFEKSEPQWEWLGYVGVAILFVLLLNVIGLILAFGKSFLFHPGYILDVVVVLTALYLEIFLDTDTAGLLVILTLWRIVRVAHGIFEVTDEAWDKESKKLEEKLQSVEASHNKDLELLRWREQRIAELEEKLNQATTGGSYS